jgi:hypothetical protein
MAAKPTHRVEVYTDDGNRSVVDTDEPDAYDDLPFTTPTVTATVIKPISD